MLYLKGYLTNFSIYTHFDTLKKKALRKTLWKKVKLLEMSNFTFSHNVFYANCILKSFDSHILVIVCIFLEFGTVSKWCIREWASIFPKFIIQNKTLLKHGSFFLEQPTLSWRRLVVYVPTENWPMAQRLTWVDTYWRCIKSFFQPGAAPVLLKFWHIFSHIDH